MSITTPSTDHADQRAGRSLKARIAPFVRPLCAIELGAGQILATSLLFSFEANIPAWQHPAYWLRQLEMLAIVAAVASVVLAWPRRREIGEIWQATAAGTSWRRPLVVNLVLFGVLMLATVGITAAAERSPGAPPWGLLWLYMLPLAATAVSLVLLAAPVAFWTEALSRFRREFVIAGGVGIVLLTLGGAARSAWDRLSFITLELVYRLLSLYEKSVAIDVAGQSVTVERFTVVIDQSCSGYEGVALVSTFLVLFLWAFRATLRFPNAFLLLPIGIVAILALNVVRIAVLVSLGAHISPDMAAGGFHSQAGWMAFLFVTIGIMLIAPRIAFFSTSAGARAAPLADRALGNGIDGDRLMLGLLAPFMALMAGAVLTSASAPFDIPLYGLKVVAAGIALYMLRDVVGRVVQMPAFLPVLVGTVIGFFWVITDIGSGSALKEFLTSIPAVAVVAWLVVRAIGGVIVVPLVEEMAFRGLLYRWFISRRFEYVDPGRFSIIALVCSSVLFGVMHQRWIAGTIAGAIFALLMIWRGRISDAIWAHVAANAVIFVWALYFRQWSLL